MKKTLMALVSVALLAFGSATADPIKANGHDDDFAIAKKANGNAFGHGLNDFLKTDVEPGGFLKNAGNPGNSLFGKLHNFFNLGGHRVGGFRGFFSLANFRNDPIAISLVVVEEEEPRSSVPEPGTLALLGLGLLMLGLARRRVARPVTAAV